MSAMSRETGPRKSCCATAVTGRDTCENVSNFRRPWRLFSSGFRVSPVRPKALAGTTTLLLHDGSALADALAEQIRCGSGGVVSVTEGGGYCRHAADQFTVDLSDARNWESLAVALKQQSMGP